MAAQIAGVFDAALQEQIKGSKILVVGAGGIGCEILKNLVLCGFSDIEIIDLDTIDVSNLNRQFLFHKQHVGKSKAEVARESALSFNPNVVIKAYHDSIFSTDYGVSFYQKFGLVLNALDNRAARNHVNRMCLTADVPLIESGTAGYNGQVELIKKGQTQCYECTPKSAQKSYPGCTIRNTPSEPIHCIVWAKHLFNQLFGEFDPDQEVSPDTADPESTGDAGADALEAAATAEGNVERVSTRKWAQNSEYDPEKVFNKLFHDDIKYLLSMENLWKTRSAPTPVKWGVYDDEQPAVDGATTSRDQKVWTLRECADVLATSIAEIKTTFAALPDGDHLVWDKDDRHPMDFVAACANIRSIVFGIPQKSRFEVKSMAGNIIPAIATTNAITAGIVVMRAFRVLQGQWEQCQSVYVRLVLNPRNQLFVPEKSLQPPNPGCIVCSDKPSIVLKIDTGKVTVASFRDDILVKTLNMLNPDVTEEGKGIILISSEEGETDCNNDKLLRDLGVVDGCILKADDFFQNYELTITVLHRDVEREDAQPFEVIADPSVLKPRNEEKSENGKATSTSDKPTENKSAEAEAKPNGDKDGSGPSPAKKLKLNCVESDSDDDICIIEDDDDEVDKNKAGPSGSSSGASSSGSSSSSSTSSPSSSSSSSSSGTGIVSSSSIIKSPPKKRKTASGETEPAAKRTKVTADDSDDDVIAIDSDSD